MKLILRRSVIAFSLYNSLRIKADLHPLPPPKWRNTHLAHLTRHLNDNFKGCTSTRVGYIVSTALTPRQFTIVILHSNTTSIHIGSNIPPSVGVAGKPFYNFWPTVEMQSKLDIPHDDILRIRINILWCVIQKWKMRPNHSYLFHCTIAVMYKLYKCDHK